MSVSSILAFLLILGGLAGIHFWEKKRFASREPDEEELLTLLARLEGTSELQQFRKAGENWNITEPRINADFDNYLLSSSTPHYVRDYLRRKRRETPDLDELLDRRINNKPVTMCSPSPWAPESEKRIQPGINQVASRCRAPGRGISKRPDLWLPLFLVEVSNC